MSIKLRRNDRVRRWTSLDKGPAGMGLIKAKSRVTEVNTLQELIDVLQVDRRGVFDHNG